jgi:hypothetical protein
MPFKIRERRQIRSTHCLWPTDRPQSGHQVRRPTQCRRRGPWVCAPMSHSRRQADFADTGEQRWIPRNYVPLLSALLSAATNCRFPLQGGSRVRLRRGAPRHPPVTRPWTALMRTRSTYASAAEMAVPVALVATTVRAPEYRFSAAARMTDRRDPLFPRGSPSR